MSNPDRIGKYDLTETVGAGGMATVYRAHDPDLARDVAVKVLHPHLCSREESRIRFRREARAVARLRHPAILEVYDTGEDQGRPYIVSEFIAGGSLDTWATQRRSLPPEVVAAVGLRIAEGLHAAHLAGVIHRDLKPGNILMGAGGAVKIADFGIAQIVDLDHLTTTGQILGSPAFMSPEHLDGGRLDARADVFSFGTLLYWLATAALPFSGPNAHVVLRRVLDADYPDPGRARPEIGEALADVIRVCLQKRPDQRYATMADVASALRAVLHLAGAGSAVETLQAFEQDPDAARTALRTQRETALLERCRRLRDHKGPAAEIRRLCGWILAFDPEHREALRLVEETMRRGGSVRKAAWAAALLAVAAVAAWFLLLPSSSSSPPDPDGGPHAVAAADAARRPDTSPTAAAGPRSDALDPDAHDADLDLGSAETAPPDVPDADLADVPPTDALDGPLDAGEAAADVPLVVEGLVRPPLQPQHLNRRVAFRTPVPCNNVEIWVDGRRLGVWGPPPGVLETTLPTGSHTFEYRPLTENCYPVEWTELLPPGAEPYSLAHRLPLRPGRLRVDTGGVPAIVDVRGRATGRANEVLEIPFEPQDGIEIGLRVAITFPGSITVRRDLNLRAGEEQTLVVSPPAPDASPDGG